MYYFLLLIEQNKLVIYWTFDLELIFSVLVFILFLLGSADSSLSKSSISVMSGCLLSGFLVFFFQSSVMVPSNSGLYSDLYSDSYFGSGSFWSSLMFLLNFFWEETFYSSFWTFFAIIKIYLSFF